MAFDKTVDEVNVNQYDAFIVPGGSWNPDALRATEGHTSHRSCSRGRKNRCGNMPWSLGIVGRWRSQRQACDGVVGNEA